MSDPYEWRQHGAGVNVSDDVAESLLRFRLDRAEAAMKERMSSALYGGGKPHEKTQAQRDRAEGYYWTRYPGQHWSLDHWSYGWWTTSGTDESWREDPPEIIGPVQPPPV